MAEKFVEINGIKICYQIHGDGYPIVLIHGFGSKKESFMAQVPALSEEFRLIIEEPVNLNDQICLTLWKCL